MFGSPYSLSYPFDMQTDMLSNDSNNNNNNYNNNNMMNQAGRTFGDVKDFFDTQLRLHQEGIVYDITC